MSAGAKNAKSDPCLMTPALATIIGLSDFLIISTTFAMSLAEA